MGMFDEVALRCPDCGETLLHQSKAGDCVLQTFSQDAVPVHIAVDIIGEHVYCETCKTSWKIEEKPPDCRTVSLVLR